jgi:hypothetical protein
VWLGAVARAALTFACARLCKLPPDPAALHGTGAHSTGVGYEKVKRNGASRHTEDRLGQVG